MKTEIQLALTAFKPSAGPQCGDRPDLCGFRLLCYHCPFSDKRKGKLFCSKFRKFIGARTKYGLQKWKEVRGSILERDGYSCIICRQEKWLCVHHMDNDPTNDTPDNLVTLCDRCHAMVHAELRLAERKTMTNHPQVTNVGRHQSGEGKKVNCFLP